MWLSYLLTLNVPDEDYVAFLSDDYEVPDEDYVAFLSVNYERTWWRLCGFSLWW